MGKREGIVSGRTLTDITMQDDLIGAKSNDALLLNDLGQLRHLRACSAPHLFRHITEGEEDDGDENPAASPVFLLEPKHVTKDGRVLQVFTRNKFFYDERGHPTFMITVIDKLQAI